jgi:hypothetical protein
MRPLPYHHIDLLYGSECEFFITKEILSMKSLIVAALLLLISGTTVSASCVNGSCTTRRPVATTLSTAKKIVVSPFKRVRNNRVARQTLNSH